MEHNNDMVFCEIKDCDKKVRKTGLCQKHYMQMYHYGRILKRTKFDKNEIVNCELYYEVILYNLKNIEIARTKISKDDYNIVKKYKWYLLKNGYVSSREKNGKAILLHRLILPVKCNSKIDHINHDTLDNRRENLRYVTTSQNSMNRKSKGFYWDKTRNKWLAHITVDGKHIHLGRFINKQDAVDVRKKAEQKYFGEFAYKEI